jgi:SAM-dependent methyltransferase
MLADLRAILTRQIPPVPWAEGEKIPWNEPGFSRRMLREHLSQNHDAASRRQTIIDRHVAWIFTTILKDKPGRVLDLGCGPGFYTNRLARRGCQCVGIDFSPASMDYARQNQADLPIKYIEENIIQANYGSGYDLVMLIYGELNAFHPDHARTIIQKAAGALKPGGCLLLEVSDFESLKQGAVSPTWSSQKQGLFSDRPYLLLSESFWDETQHTLTERYFVMEIETTRITRMAASTQAYTGDEYKALLKNTGLYDVRVYPNMTGEQAGRFEFFPITGFKPG